MKNIYNFTNLLLFDLTAQSKKLSAACIASAMEAGYTARPILLAPAHCGRSAQPNYRTTIANAAPH